MYRRVEPMVTVVSWRGWLVVVQMALKELRDKAGGIDLWRDRKIGIQDRGLYSVWVTARAQRIVCIARGLAHCFGTVLAARFHEA